MERIGIDVIGDVHGRAEPLRALLERLGYRWRDAAYRHPWRTVMFLGDLVDRGADVGGTVALVRAMVASGSAEIVLGNHELNLLRWFAEDDHDGHLRPHSERNTAQAAASLHWFATEPEAAAEALDWFQNLPLFLERSGARFVHACWHPADLETLAGRTTLRALGWDAPGFKATAEGRAVERLLKGPEAGLPVGLTAADADGNQRHDARLRWWLEPGGLKFRAAVMAELSGSAEGELPAGLESNFAPPKPGAGPVFIGHYNFAHGTAALHPQVACVDFGGPQRIGAYRWDGELVIQPDHFVY